METQLDIVNEITLKPILNENGKIKLNTNKIQTIYMPIVNLQRENSVLEAELKRNQQQEEINRYSNYHVFVYLNYTFKVK